MKSKIVLCLTLLLGFAGAMAQSPNWGSDAAKAQEQYALFSDFAKQNNFNEAVKPLRYLLKNAPELGAPLYVKGAQVYEGLVAQTKDPKLLTAYQDTALLLYDLRIKYFGDEANVLNRKGLKAYAYLNNRPNSVDQLYPLYKQIVDSNKDETYNANVQVYMDLVCRKKTAGQLTDEQVLAEYDRLNAITEKKLASNDEAVKQSWTVTKDYIDKMLQSCVTIDCNFVKTQFGPKFQQNKEDVEMAKKIFGLMATGKCTDDPLFLEAGEVMVKKEPSYGVYRVLAKISEGNKNFDKAIEFYEASVQHATNASDKAASYKEIGEAYARRGSKDAARTNFRRAAENGMTSAYASIGNLYLGSYKECGEGDVVKSKLFAIAAYEMFEKAGDKAGMANARKYFPSAEDIFQTVGSEKIGTQMNTGCWINETVTLQKK